jgi:hypothetical protein
MLPIDGARHGDFRTERVPWASSLRPQRRAPEQDRRSDVCRIACRMRAQLPLSRYLAAGTTDAHTLMKEHELRARVACAGFFPTPSHAPRQLGPAFSERRRTA